METVGYKGTILSWCPQERAWLRLVGGGGERFAGTAATVPSSLFFNCRTRAIYVIRITIAKDDEPG